MDLLKPGWFRGWSWWEGFSASVLWWHCGGQGRGQGDDRGGGGGKLGLLGAQEKDDHYQHLGTCDVKDKSSRVGEYLSEIII